MRSSRAGAVRPLAWLTLVLLGVQVGLAPVGAADRGDFSLRMVSARVVFPTPDPIPGGVQTIPVHGAGQVEPASTPAPSGSGIGGGPLPETGFPVAWLVVLALGMMLAGLGLGYAARRRG